MDGILNIKKEAGFTSHDVVAKLRGILKMKKIGHTGTLDPDATGVLPVCLGKATKLCDMIGGWSKTYEAVMLLGTTTDTEDTSGQIRTVKEVSFKEDEIISVIQSFIGPYDQIPPMYSAKKVQGKKLYELARQGIEIERKPAHVEIYDIEIQEIALPYVTFSVHCSKGTYIRSLCRDIGDQLGCGACMASLIRTRVSDFGMENAVTLQEVEQARDEERLSSLIRPIDSVFMDYPSVIVRQDGEKYLYNGNPVSYRFCENMPKTDFNLIRVYDRNGRFAGVYVPQSDLNRLKPYKLFLEK